MCGILAVVSKRDSVIDESTLIKMRDEMRHRGPDDAGIYINQERSFALAHRRLAILDTTEHGHQPMHTPSGNVIVFNGEIYNYIELHQDKLKDQKFDSSCDTEVLIKLIETYGPESIPWLNGMWGFVYFDNQTNSLLISRDRYGEKPLYYYEDENVFIVSSEIKPILASPNYHAKENSDAIETYLQTGLVDGLEETFFKNIFRFPQACFGTYNLNTHKLETKRYYAIEDSIEELGNVSENDVIDHFRELFLDSVRIRLRSDVPVGACLSGGLDSSSIYAAANHMSKENPITSFSAKFEGEQYDESRFYKAVRDKYGLQGHEISPSFASFPEDIKKIIYYLEEPSKAMGVFPQWHVIKLASQHVKVLLDGQGGDEVLAGYTPYHNYHIADLITGKQKGLSQLARYATSTKVPGLINIAAAMKVILRSPATLNNSFLNGKLMADVNTSMLPALLKYEDKIGMAFSIEARLPFMDYRLVNYAFSLPNFYKINQAWTKYVLRQSMNELLPHEVAYRKDKKGFPTPFFQILESVPHLREHIPAGTKSEWKAWRYMSLAIWRELFFSPK